MQGHDTTGMALMFTLFLLAEHKAEQEKCREEATALLNRTNGNPQLTDLQELPYLERCIKESLRLYPPVATLLRYTPEDLQLKHALIPGGTHIFIHLYDTHRDTNFWEEPDKFDPDRFLPENSQNRHPYAYVPFSAGPRNCIGQKFAMMEMKSIIARLLCDFRLEPIDRIADMKLTADIVIRPMKPVRIKFVSIKK
jgi:cytochrome P450 family 4